MLRLVEYPSTGAALPVSRKLPGRGLLLSGWESITRDTALVRSCGLYFAPQRFVWRRCVGAILATASGTCVVNVSTTLKPETSVTVKSLLDSLATLPHRNKAQEVLLDVVLDEAKIGVASMLGSRVRVKTGAGLPMINRKSARVVLLAG
ncbi:DUF2300 domain-containing protein [Escherichia coli]